ncbi:MAG: hypothetical protein HPY82_15415 [Gammaproteobacteria bacterium]|nr:hypothetical protein [Gammaproteobacteria bacterium]
MHDISNFNREGLPSTQALLKATLVALVIGALVLVTTVLPAEYGVDPTGLGSRMGLTALSEATAGEVPSAEASSANLLVSAAPVLSPVWKSANGYRNDSLALTLQPGEGAEIKARMAIGDRFVFSWQAEGGAVNFDMHGEPPNAGETFSSYWKGLNQSQAHGEFIAPFAGTHGWYWRNRGTAPVTVTVSTSGFYEKLYKP